MRARSVTPFACFAAISLASSMALAAPTRFLESTGWKQLYGGFTNDIGGQWDSPLVGKAGTNLLDVVYLSNSAVGYCGTASSTNASSAGGCYGQCVELTARWFSHYVYADHANENQTWIHGNGGAGFCDCARTGCGTGMDTSLFEVHAQGDGYVPVSGDVLSLSYVHAEVLTNSWVDGNGMHFGIAMQNVSAESKEDWRGDHFDSESCIVHAVGMPTLTRVRVYSSDVNGDGKADACGRASDGIHCVLSNGGAFATAIVGPAWKDSDGWWLPRYDSTIQFPDVNGDGKADACARDSQGIVCALSDGNGFPTTIRGPAWSDASGWSAERAFSTIEFPDVNGDGKADVCGRASDAIYCAMSTGSGFDVPVKGPTWSDASGWGASLYYSTLAFPDIDGDGRADICARGAAGVTCAISDGTGAFPKVIAGPAWSDGAGWGTAKYAATVQFGDLDHDGKEDVCGRNSKGIVCARSNGAGFDPEFTGPAWTDASGWDAPRYYSTIQMLDFDGDGKLDLCGRGSAGVECAGSDGHGFRAAIAGPAWSDANGWGDPSRHATIAATDVNGDGKADLCARGAAGLECALSTGAGFAAPSPGPGWADAQGWRSLPYYGSIRYTGRARLQTPAAPARTPARGVDMPDLRSTSDVTPDQTIDVPGCACTTTSDAPSPFAAFSTLLVVCVLSRRRKVRS